VKDKLIAAGFDARRVPLSGRQRPEGEHDIPNADLIVCDRFRCKAKTTKAKKYVLVFNFTRTPPFVVVRFDDFLDLLKMWKEKGKNK
jgi:hypothetical protein